MAKEMPKPLVKSLEFRSGNMYFYDEESCTWNKLKPKERYEYAHRTDDRFCDRCGAPVKLYSAVCPYCRVPYKKMQAPPMDMVIDCHPNADLTETVTLYADNKVVEKRVAYKDDDHYYKKAVEEYEKLVNETSIGYIDAAANIQKSFGQTIVQMPFKEERKKSFLERWFKKC